MITPAQEEKLRALHKYAWNEYNCACIRAEEACEDTSLTPNEIENAELFREIWEFVFTKLNEVFGPV